MRFGLSVYDVTATELVEVALAAEAAGFDSLWLGEHLLLPVDYGAVHPTRRPEQERAARIVGPDTRLVDPLVALAGAAAHTRRLQLATGIYLLPLRHPLAVARATLTLQELSGGRLLLGVGAGWLRDEFEALAVPFGDRALRLEESIEILRRAWAGGVFEHHGTVYDFGPVQLTAHPVRVPLILGGTPLRPCGGPRCGPTAGSRQETRRWPRPSNCSASWRRRNRRPGGRCRSRRTSARPRPRTPTSGGTRKSASHR